jgi:hypothetical protein
MGALVGALFVEGQGYTQDASTVSLDLGATSWVRASADLAAAPVTLWVGAAALIWARPQRLHVDGPVAQAALPAFDIMLGGGLLWTFGGVLPAAP